MHKHEKMNRKNIKMVIREVPLLVRPQNQRSVQIDKILKYICSIGSSSIWTVNASQFFYQNLFIALSWRTFFFSVFFSFLSQFETSFGWPTINLSLLPYRLPLVLRHYHGHRIEFNNKANVPILDFRLFLSMLFLYRRKHVDDSQFGMSQRERGN